MGDLNKTDKGIDARNVIRHISFEELNNMSIQILSENVLYSHGNYEFEELDL